MRQGRFLNPFSELIYSMLLTKFWRLDKVGIPPFIPVYLTSDEVVVVLR